MCRSVCMCVDVAAVRGSVSQHSITTTCDKFTVQSLAKVCAVRRTSHATDKGCG